MGEQKKEREKDSERRIIASLDTVQNSESAYRHHDRRKRGRGEGRGERERGGKASFALILC